MRYIFGILLFLGGSIAAYFAVGSLLWQDRAVRTFIPTDAVVVFSRLEIHRGKSTSYSPAVTYSYTFHDTSYRSTRVLPFAESGAASWAQPIVSRYPVGAKVTAYVNPAAPAESVLVRDYSTTPYVLSCITLFAAAAGIALLLGLVTPGSTTMRAVPLDADGWQLLLPSSTIRRRRRNVAILLLVSGVPTAAVLGHYLRVVRPLDVRNCLLLALLVLVPILVELTLFVRAHLLSRHISDARLQINPAPMNRYQPLQLRAELDAYYPLRVTSLRARVVCIEHFKERHGGKTTYGTRIHAEKTIQLAADATVPAGQILAGEGQVAVDPGSSPPSRLPHAWGGYPSYTWEIRLNLALAGAPDYHAVFPLTAL